MFSKPFIITVCHQKGGVGKTTTVSSLGSSLAELNYQVLMVDMDPSANLTTGHGIIPSRKIKSAADILLGNDSLQNICLPTSQNGLSLIPSNPDMVTVSRFIYLRNNYEYILKDIFKREGQQFDIILIDCPPTIGSLAISSLTAAHQAIIPLQCEYYSLQALQNILKTIKATRERMNPQLSYRLLITMFDRRGKFHARVYEQIKEHFSGAIFETIIGFDTKLRESQFYGVSILAHASNTRAARQYRQLARELLSYLEVQKLTELSVKSA